MPRREGDYFSNYPASLKRGLLGWWTFDDGAAKDSSGNNKHGVLAGTTKPSPIGGVMPGMALRFDGTTSHVDTTLNPSGLTTFSISAWVYHNSIVGNQRLIANSHTDADNVGFQFVVGADFEFNVGNGTTFAAISSSSFVVSRWYHVAATMDIAGNIIATYINGALATSGAAITGSMSAGLNNISIGYNPTYAGDFFNGRADDIRIYNRVLSVGEIVTLSKLGRLRFPTRNLVGAATGPVSVTLTGVSSTSAAGIPTVTGAAPVAVTGVAATSAAGIPTVGVTATVSLTGVASTSAAGAPTETGFGNVSLTGVLGTSAAGTATVSGKANVTINGVSATSSANVPTVTGFANVSLTGVQSASAAGIPTVTGFANVTLTGVASASQIGTISVQVGGAVNVNLTGLAATSAAGTITVAGKANVTLSGIASASQVGTITATAGTVNVNLTGVQAAGSIGTLSFTGAANVSFSGVAAISAANVPTVSVPSLHVDDAATFLFGGIGHFLYERAQARKLAKITRKAPQPKPIDRRTQPTFAPIASPPIAAPAPAPVVAPMQNELMAGQMQAAAAKKKRDLEAILLLAS